MSGGPMANFVLFPDEWQFTISSGVFVAHDFADADGDGVVTKDEVPAAFLSADRAPFF